MKEKDCPCFSGKLYKLCCKPFHEGVLPTNALELMRSRYCAYAMRFTKYIIATTHPDNPHYEKNHQAWMRSLMNFSKNTRFEGLNIIEFIDGDKEAYVTFEALLTQHGNDASFVEKSRFVKSDEKWLFREANEINSNINIVKF